MATILCTVGSKMPGYLWSRLTTSSTGLAGAEESRAVRQEKLKENMVVAEEVKLRRTDAQTMRGIPGGAVESHRKVRKRKPGKVRDLLLP